MFRVRFDHTQTCFTGRFDGVFEAVRIEAVPRVDEDVLVVLNGPEVDASGQEVLLTAGVEARLGYKVPLLSGLDVVVDGVGFEEAVDPPPGLRVHHSGAYFPTSLACASTWPCIAK